jgi:hypothetical protein
MICNGDKQIENILQPSFDESFVISTQEHAIEYIGKRSIINCDTKEKRLQNVRKILCKDMLSHVSVTDNNKSIVIWSRLFTVLTYWLLHSNNF